MIFLLLRATAASPKLAGERVGLHHPLNEYMLARSNSYTLPSALC